MSSAPVLARAVIPFTTLTPEACSHVADSAERAIALFDAWSIPRCQQARLREAVAELRRVAAAGTWGATSDELAYTNTALSVAGDFNIIVQALTGDPIDSVSDEIGPLLRHGLATWGEHGTLGDVQSQYWFGTILGWAGLNPGIPEPGERRPDFVIRTQSMDFGVEHKEPESARSARRALDTAAAQLRDYDHVHNTPGFIVVDLSQAVHARRAIGMRLPTIDGLRLAVGPHFFALADSLDQRAKSYQQSDKYDRIIGVICYARASYWLERKDLLEPRSTVWVSATIIERGCRGLLQHTASRVFQSLKGALEEFADGSVKNVVIQPGITVNDP